MTPKHANTLAIAVSSGKIGYVFLTDGELRDWGLSSVAARSPEAAKAKVSHWIETYRPRLIVTEKLTLHTRKSGRTIRNINVVSDTAQKSDAHHVEFERLQNHDNKYQEADDLCRKYPVIENWKPRPRKPWESEPKTAVIFEALSLADQIER